MQGQTVRKGTKLVIHWVNNLQEGMAYVMLGRCEQLSDLYIMGKFDPTKIRCNYKALMEAYRLEKLSLTGRITDEDDCHLSIVSINIRSLEKHLPDLRNDFVVKQKDLICLQETWLKPDNEQSKEIEDYYSFFGSYT